MTRSIDFSRSSPPFVILDLEEAVDQFYQDLSADTVEECEHCVEEVLAEILLYISDKEAAPNGLTALAQDLNDTYTAVADNSLGIAARTLGTVVYDQLLTLGAYGGDNKLRYRLSDKNLLTKAPLLEKFLDGTGVNDAFARILRTRLYGSSSPSTSKTA